MKKSQTHPTVGFPESDPHRSHLKEPVHTQASLQEQAQRLNLDAQAVALLHLWMRGSWGREKV